MTLLETALNLARNKIKIFPCNQEKEPLVPKGFYDASYEESVIRAWWTKWPNASIGMPTGITNGIIVLDVDVKNGKDGEASLKNLLAKYNAVLPITRIVKTPSGGRHIYFDNNGLKISGSVEKIGIGLDIKAEGGYIIMPPSQNGNGKNYVIEVNEGIADLPEWLKNLITEPIKKPTQPPPHKFNDITSRSKVEDALKYISADCSYQDWIDIGMSLFSWSSTEGLSVWDAWSRTTPNRYEDGLTTEKWKTFNPTSITIATLFGKAKDSGWRPYQTPTPHPSIPPKKREIIILPGGGTSITESATNIFKEIAPTHRLFTRGGMVMELRRDEKKGLRLEVMRAQAFRSRIEKLGTLFAWRAGKGGEAVLKSTTCPADTAEALLSCHAAEELLPTVRGLTSCPVIVEIEGKIQILGKGYHPTNGGLLIMSGEQPPEIPIEQAITLLQMLVGEFDFSTPSDRSRALASFITPALRIGGWLRGNIPIDMAEANESQSGKGYRQKLLFAVYNESPSIVALKNGGVGGLDESVSQALIAGRPFIQIDNVRGKIESQFIEMMMTAGGIIMARVPQRAEVPVDSRHFILMMTSNGLETTPDLANRSNIIRIRKRHGYVFKKYSEGDLLDYVTAYQTTFLGAIFAVIKEWHRLGKQRNSDTTHDFREWSQTLGWIIENILKEAPLMDGHRQAQERVSNPALSWLRKVALAVEADHRLDEEIMASDLAELCEGHSIEIPGLRDFSDEIGRNKRVGIIMRKCFGELTEIEIDRCIIKKTEKEHYYPSEQQNKMLKVYIFSIHQPELSISTGNFTESP
jgi:hypothetical protein